MSNFWNEIEGPILALAPMEDVTDTSFRELVVRLSEPGCLHLLFTEFTAVDGMNHPVGKKRVSERLIVSDSERAILKEKGMRLIAQIWGNKPEVFHKVTREITEEYQFDGIDINMGCPAKKVCNKAAGSALMKDEKLVRAILEAVVNAVDIPVTLKMRTGWDRDNRNAPVIARMAEDAGIQALAVHGRTRADKYNGEAEYDTIAAVKASVGIPVFANGDISTPEKARDVLAHTGADGLLIGRGAQGRPWIFREILHFLETGTHCQAPALDEVEQILSEHLAELHSFYGDKMGVRIARKHVGWYLQSHDESKQFRSRFNAIEDTLEQKDSIAQYFARLRNGEVFAA